jgi:alkyldihydroxyacetonephosphate synthase
MDALSGVVPADRVTTDPTELDLHATDFWPRLVMARRRGDPPVRPAAVVRPTTTDEVAAVVSRCAQRGIAVVPYGAGTGVCGGAAALEGAVTLDLKALDRVVALDEESGTVTVQPGMICRSLEDHLRHRGWTLGHHPSSAHCSSIGGLLAIRSAGQASTGLGKLEDMVVGLEAVLADGTVFRAKTVPGTAAGPDLSRLFIGGEGTTGIITEATLRILPAPEVTLDRGYLFPDLASGVAGLRALMRTGLPPTVVRLYDEADTATVFGGQGLEVPEGCLTIVANEGDERVAGFADRLHRDVLTEHGADDLGREPGEHWRAHRHDMSYRFAEYMRPGGSFGDAVMLDTMEVAGTWASLVPLYDAVREALGEHSDLVLAHISHVYDTGAAIYFTFGAAPAAGGEVAGDAAEAEGIRLYDAAWDAGQRAALEAGGTISHHHGIGRLRVPWFADELGPGRAEVLRRVRSALDPDGVLNPETLELAAGGPR